MLKALHSKILILMSSYVPICWCKQTNSTLPQQYPQYIANSKIKSSSNSSESKGSINKGGINLVKIDFK